MTCSEFEMAGHHATTSSYDRLPDVFSIPEKLSVSNKQKSN